MLVSGIFFFQHLQSFFLRFCLFESIVSTFLTNSYEVFLVVSLFTTLLNLLKSIETVPGLSTSILSTFPV